MAISKERQQETAAFFLFQHDPTRHPMKFYVLAALTVIASVASFAQTPTITLTAKNTTPGGSKSYTMFLGASRLGTVGVDSALNEIEIPTLPLPSGIFYVWSAPPTEEVIWLSPRDFRYLAPGTTYREEYKLQVNWDGGTLKWTWLTPLPELIDSAWIVDGYTDFPDNVAKAKLVPNASLEIANPSITLFKLLVWFNTSTLTVHETAKLPVSVFPQPCSDVVNIKAMSPLRSYTVSDLQGRVIEGGTAEGSDLRVSTAHLATASYVLALTHTDGSTERSLFIKQ